MINFLAPKHSLLANAVGTVKFCLFIDKTFESVNARTINSELGKPLRSAVRDGSTMLIVVGSMPSKYLNL